jgi:FMN-dependent NADH-azoreductase
MEGFKRGFAKMKLLHIDSSARANSISRRLTAQFIEVWKRNHAGGDVIYRDLATTVIPPVTDDWAATFADPATLTSVQKAYLSISDELTAELLAADTIVIGSPMYNYSISAPLKAWLDQIVRMGKTFGISAGTPVGLLGDKRAMVITTRGGVYGPDSPTAALDFQEPYLRAILSFIGLSDLTFLHVERQMKPEGEIDFAAAVAQINELAK